MIKTIGPFRDGINVNCHLGYFEGYVRGGVTLWDKNGKRLTTDAVEVTSFQIRVGHDLVFKDPMMNYTGELISVEASIGEPVVILLQTAVHNYDDEYFVTMEYVSVNVE